MQVVIHYGLHLLFPVVIAYVFFRSEWVKVYLIFLATMLVDLDHLLASPVFAADRCSIHYHLLHTYYAIAVYILLLFLRKPFRIIGIGLLLHMFTDLLDCVMTYMSCQPCLDDAPARGLIEWIVGLWQ